MTEIYKACKPILRIFVDDKGGSKIPLNKKFGMRIQDVHELLHVEPRFHIYGLAFHVGSNCISPASYQSAFESVREFLSVFRHYPNIFTPELLDIGGGFSGLSENDNIFKNEIAPLIQKEVSSLPFRKKISEPGRFFVEESCKLHVDVIGRNKKNITIDESVYGIFSGVLFDGFKPKFKCITRRYENEPFTIFGRTCDSTDKIAENVYLPSKISDHDKLAVDNIGAYSWVSSSTFNGFSKPAIVVLS